jgi:phosphoserine phosphatase
MTTESTKSIQTSISVADMLTSTCSKKFTLREAAAELGVSYWTARRLFRNECGRYSGTTGTIVYSETPLTRFQRVRMTYVITGADIERVRRKMWRIAA